MVLRSATKRPCTSITAGDEAFYVLEGQIDVQDGAARHRVAAGQMHIIPAGSAHTFATVDPDGARVLCIMTPEIDALIRALHNPPVDDAVWEHYHSVLA